MKNIVLAVSLVATCLAADPPVVTRSRVQVVHVKPDMNNEFMDLQKNEVVPAMKKAGVKSRSVYSTRFGLRGEYVIITPFASFGEFDGDSPYVKALGAAGSARLTAKLLKCIDSQTDYVNTRQDDLSNLVEIPTPPNYLVVSRMRVAQGKLAEFRNLIKSDYQPIYAKAKKRWTVNRRSLGANSSDFSASYGIDKLSELDAGSMVRQTLGNDAADRLGVKHAPIFTIIESVVRQRMADLSY